MIKKKMLVLFGCCMFLMAVVCKAELVFENFAGDPLTHGWMQSIDGNSTFTYNAAGYDGTGYLDASVDRDLLKCDRYSTALSQTYTQTQDFWMSWDMKISVAATKEALVGVLNSGGDNYHNSLMDEFPNAGWRIDTRFSDAAGYKRYFGSASASPGSLIDRTVRVMVNYDYSGSPDVNSFATIIVKDLDAGVEMSTRTMMIIAPGESFTFDLFGLGNMQYAGIAGSVVFKLDNLYFSTEGAMTGNPMPSWIPEPATMLLFGLGAFIVRKVKK